jgi:hypothetical protein
MTRRMRSWRGTGTMKRMTRTTISDRAFGAAAGGG